MPSAKHVGFRCDRAALPPYPAQNICHLCACLYTLVLWESLLYVHILIFILFLPISLI